MPRAGFYSPSEADQFKVRIEEHVRLATHHIERLRAVVPGAGSIPSQLDEAEVKVKAAADDLHELIDQRTEVEAGAKF